MNQNATNFVRKEEQIKDWLAVNPGFGWDGKE
jgi:hypothetical protein